MNNDINEIRRDQAIGPNFLESEDKEANIEIRNKKHKEALQRTGFWGESGAGCIIMSKDSGRILIPLRSKKTREPGTWGTWGGAIDENETPKETVMREVYEEAGYVGVKKIIPLHVFKHESGFKYYNFLVLVENEFNPTINFETKDWDWFYIDNLPSPLHFGLKGILNNKKDVNIIMTCLNNIMGNINESMKKNNKKIIITEEQFKMLTEINILPEKYLYHATYRPLLKKIKLEGLGGISAKSMWGDSKRGVVYLAKEDYVAASYAEVAIDENEQIPESWEEKIVILTIDTSYLDPNKLFIDENVLDNEGDTLEYRGVIPWEAITKVQNYQ